MLDHFLHLVESSVREPDGAIGRLPLSSKEEEERVLRLGESPFPSLGDERVHELFDRVVCSFPDAVAIEWEDGVLSYGELNERAGALARYLRGQGVASGVRVGLCMDRSAEMIIGMLGTLKAGGTYVPLDPTYPSERLDFMTKDAETVLILSTERFAKSVATIGTKVILLDRDRSLIESFAERELPGSSGPDDLAYVIFTSGSTGQPKGVAVPHRAIVRLVINTNYVSLGSEDRVAHLSNVCFDAATFEIWGALLNGARIVVISKATALEPRRFGAALRGRKVTTIFLTTALFNEMAADDAGVFNNIRQVLFGGEVVNAHWVRRVLESGAAPERLLHVYGPTECTTFATFHPVGHVPEGASTVPIGRPISNTMAYVLDRQGNPVPIGVPGELYLGGPGLARGYLNRPELTREKFVDSPFHAGEALYRTGDIVKYLPDGNIEFIGRADSQVKIRGFRIEPGEVEALLKNRPDIEEAAVVVREDKAGERRLVAYVVSQSDKIITESRIYLQRKLPSYMIPSTMVRLSALPLTPSGKIDRLALPEAERDTTHSEEAAPLTPSEEIVASVWREVLGLEELGRHDNFFELGGHSLLATRVISRLRASLGIEVPLRAVFDNPTVSELGEFIANAHGAARNEPSESKSDALREEALF